MEKSVSLIIVAVGLVLVGVLSETGLASASAPAALPAPRQQEAEELAKKVAALEAKVAEQALHIAAVEEGLRRVGTWFQAMPTTLGAMESGLDDVHKKGFTYAGANLAAREVLLKTLRDFASSMKSGNPFAAPKGR